MTYTKANPLAKAVEVTKNSGAPSPEAPANLPFVPRDLKFKPIALEEIMKVA